MEAFPALPSGQRAMGSLRPPLASEPMRSPPARAPPAAPSAARTPDTEDDYDLEPSVVDSPLESSDPSSWVGARGRFVPPHEGDDNSSVSSDGSEDVWENMERIMRRASNGAGMPNRGSDGLDSWPDSWQESYLRTGLTPIAESLHSYSTDWNGSPSRESLVESHPPTLPGSPSGESRASGTSSSRPQSRTDHPVNDSVWGTSSPVSTHSRSRSSPKTKPNTFSNNAPLPSIARPKLGPPAQPAGAPPPVTANWLSGKRPFSGVAISGGETSEVGDDTGRERTGRGPSSPVRARTASGFSSQALEPVPELASASAGFVSHAKATHNPDDNFPAPVSEVASPPPSGALTTLPSLKDRPLSGSVRSASSSGESRPDSASLTHSRQRASSGADSVGDGLLHRRESTGSTAAASSVGPNASASVVNYPISASPQSLVQQQQQASSAASPATGSATTPRPSGRRSTGSRAGSRNAILAGISSVSVSLREKASSVPDPVPAARDAEIHSPGLFVRQKQGSKGGSKSPLSTTLPSSTLYKSQSPASSQNGSTLSTNSDLAKGGSDSGKGSGSEPGPESLNSSRRFSECSETSTASVEDEVHLHHQNASGEEEGGAITPRAQAGSPQAGSPEPVTPPSTQHLRQRTPWSTGLTDTGPKLNVAPVPALDLKLESSSVKSRADSIRSSHRGSDVLPNEGFESLSDRSRSPYGWSGAPGAMARGNAAFGDWETSASATLSALNSLSDPKEEHSPLSSTVTSSERKKSATVDVLNQTNWSDLLVMRYLLSWGKDVHTARALHPVPPVEMLGDAFLCGREREGVTPTGKRMEWSFLDQLPTRAQWTLVQQDGKKKFNFAGYLFALVTAVVALLSATTPTRLVPGSRTESEYSHHSRRFSAGLGESDHYSHHSSSSGKASIHSRHSCGPRKTQWGWQERDLGTLHLLVLHTAFVPLKLTFDKTVGAVYRWDSISTSTLAFLVWIAAWKYGYVVPVLITGFLIVMVSGGLAAYDQDLTALRRVASPSLGLTHQWDNVAESSSTADSADLSVDFADVAAWAESLTRVLEQLGNVLFWRAPGASRRAVALLLTIWLLLLALGVHWVSLLAAILFFSAPLRLKLGLGGQGGRAIFHLLAAPDDTELAMELIRQRASSAWTGTPLNQTGLAAGLSHAPVARLAQQSLGQPTWLGQATYGIQVDSTPLLLVLSPTLLNFTQVPGMGLDELSGLSLPPSSNEQQVVLDVSLDRIKVLAKLGHEQLYILLRPASKWSAPPARAAERFASTHLESSSRGKGVALTFPDTSSRDTAFNHLLAVAPFVWRTERL